MTDAIVRTLGRVYGTGRRLLEWTHERAGPLGVRPLRVRIRSAQCRRDRRSRSRASFSRPRCVRRASRERRSCSSSLGDLAARGLGALAGSPYARRTSLCPPPARRLRRSHGAEDLAVLRDVRRSRRPPPAARQFPGGSQARRRAPDVADEHRSVAPRHGRRPRFRVDRGRRRPPSAWTRRSPRRAPSSASGGISSTGTTPRRSLRSSLDTSRPSTAATSSPTCSSSSRPASRWPSGRSAANTILAGLRDVLRLRSRLLRRCARFAQARAARAGC